MTETPGGRFSATLLVLALSAYAYQEAFSLVPAWFEIQTRSGPYAVVGDCVYWYSNVEKMWPPGYHQGNAFNQIHLYRRLAGLLKGETARIIPGHDPLIWDRHSSWIPREFNQVGEVYLAAGELSRKPL